MNVSTAHSTRPAPTHTVTLLDTSNSDTIHDVGIQDSTTGPHTRSTTSTWNGGSPRELTVKELSGKRGAHQPLTNVSPAPNRGWCAKPRQRSSMYPAAMSS